MFAPTGDRPHRQAAMRKTGADLTHGRILETLVRLSLPIMASNFLQTFYNLMDTFWLGKLGPHARMAVAVSGNSFPLVFFITSFATGFVVAGTALIARFKGMNTESAIRDAMGQIMLLMGAFFLLFLGIAVFLSHPITHWLGTPPEIAAMTDQYLRIIMISLAFTAIFLFFQGALYGLGDTMTPMTIQLISLGVNFVLDPLMIFGWMGFPRMETVGAAGATLISKIVSAVLVTWFLFRRYRSMIPNIRHLRPNMPLMGSIFRIGLPSSLAQSATSFGFLTLQGFINSYGMVVMSAYAIGQRFTGFFLMPSQGIGSAMTAFIGQNLGAGRVDRAEKSFRLAIALVMLIMTIGGLVIYFFGAQLTHFFIDDPAVIEVGDRMFKLTAFSGPAFAIMFVFFGVFNGAGHTMPTLVLNILRLWVLRIPFTFLMAGQWILVPWMADSVFRPALEWITLCPYPYDALWWSMLVSNMIASAMAYAVYRKGKWKTVKIRGGGTPE
jgi:putative MATE family efflux protein